MLLIRQCGGSGNGAAAYAMGAHTCRSLRGVVGSAATDAEDELSTALPSTGRNYCGAPHGRTRKRWRGSIPCWAVAMLLGDGECIKNNNDQKTYRERTEAVDTDAPFLSMLRLSSLGRERASDA